MKQALWRHDFILAIVLNFFMAMVFYLLVTSIAGYAIHQFAVGDAMAGFASSSFVLGAVISRVLAGKYLDTLGRKKMLMLAMLGYTLGSMAYFLAESTSVFLIVRIIHGIAFGAGNTALMAAAQGVIPKSRRSEGNGYLGMATTVSMAIGPYLGVYLPENLSYLWLFNAATVFSAIALAVSILIKLPEVEKMEGQPRGKRRFHFSSIIDPKAFRIGSVMLFGGMAYATILVFLASYATHQGVPKAASLYFISFAIFAFLSRFINGIIQDRHGDNVVMYPVLVAFIISNLLLAFFPSMAGFTIAGMFAGFGFGSMVPCVLAIVVNSAPTQRVSVATATYFVLLDGGSGIGPVILGMLIPLTGERGMYVVAAVLTVLALAIYHLVHGKYAAKLKAERLAAQAREADTQPRYLSMTKEHDNSTTTE